MKNKRITFTLLVILCTCIIFIFSNQVGKTSESISDGFTIQLINVYEKVTNKEISEQRKEELVKDLRKFIRKSAHFTIYLLLGIFTYGALKSYDVKHPTLCSILFCLIYACTDELHQTFVNARTGRVFDVFIDTCGACLGNAFILLLRKIMKKKMYMKCK